MLVDLRDLHSVPRVILEQLIATGKKTGCASLCIGGGMGVALAVERV